MRRKIDVTPAEMMQLREQGLSNHDIARSLDVSINTVRRYIGAQPGRMDNLEAFCDVPSPKKEVKEVVVERATLMPKYEPKPVLEKYNVGDKLTEIEMDGINRTITFSSCTGDIMFDYEEIPELVQFLSWAMRERMEASADVRAKQIQEP